MINPNRRHPGTGGSDKTGPAAMENFLRRTASAAVLAPLAILAAFWGSWVFTAVCAITAAVVFWEWSVLVARAAGWRILGPGLAALFIAAILTQKTMPYEAMGVVVLGAFTVAAVSATLPAARRPDVSSRWPAAGAIYAGIVLIFPIVLRSDPEMGLAAVLFLFATVWATDILAYLVGRSLGGPLLWRRVSPKKTWAGAIGGLAGGIAAGSAVAYASAGTQPLVAGVLALILSIAAQLGDLLESWVKRRFGAKDASTLIPGHGGVMDRVDGLLLAALAAVLIGALRMGMAASARGLLLW
ncbi:MAG TPA: phosphatidate cytidylyltransferase [Xanthobacteraceae bacterium]|nr:phosphatidate cytidylyltransferase [Xanthobacteraceae bacterium]